MGRRNSIFWGIVLVMMGTLFLLDNLGFFPGFDVWPLFWAGFLILAGGLLIYNTVNRPKAEVEEVRVPLEGASRAVLVLNHGAGELKVKPGSTTDLLVAGECKGGVKVSSKLAADTLEVTLSVPSSSVPFDWRPEGMDWDLRLNDQVPYDHLEVNSGANSADLDLVKLRIARIDLKTGASSTTLRLPERGLTQARVESGAASVSLVIPQGVAGRIHGSGGMYTMSVDTQRFPKTGGVYQSADFETAADRVEIEVTMGAGSVDVR